jgi:hypothetical protein
MEQMMPVVAASVLVTSENSFLLTLWIRVKDE